MTWKLHAPEIAQRLESKFANLKIDFSQPGFYDQDNFLLAEQKNPRILDEYAQYVEVRAYAQSYLDDARKKIEVASEAIRAAVEADGRLGACVDAAGMLGRMLDRLGVWNYVAKPCLTISYPPEAGLPNTCFYGIDSDGFAASHAIVVAPPFYIIDVTVKYQPYATAGHAAYLPKKVLLDEFKRASWSHADVLSPEVIDSLEARRISLSEYLIHHHRRMLDVAEKLPAREYISSASNEASLKYTIVAIGGFIEQLEDLTDYKPCGRTALEIFNEDVLPHL